jgi:hypothetical protein
MEFYFARKNRKEVIPVILVPVLLNHVIVAECTLAPHGIKNCKGEQFGCILFLLFKFVVMKQDWDSLKRCILVYD